MKMEGLDEEKLITSLDEDIIFTSINDKVVNYRELPKIDNGKPT